MHLTDPAFEHANGVRQRYRAQYSKGSIAGIDDSLFSGSYSHQYTEYGATDRKDGQRFRQYKNWVYICVSYIVRKIAAQPVKAGEIIGADDNPERGGRPRRKSIAKHRLPKHIGEKAGAGDVVELTHHDALDAIAHPNEFQSKNEFLQISVANILLSGICYWIKGSQTDSDGNRNLEAIAVPSWWLIPSHKNGPFSSYTFRPPGVAEGVQLPGDVVDKTYLPCPWSLTDVWSPLHATVSATQIDEHILHNQVEMFARGIMPNLALRVGKIAGPDGKPTLPPTLNDVQRRQLVRSVRTVWSRTMNYGDPAILDGLIDGIERIQMTPAEMDWIQSGKVTKERIFQAFGVNPIVVGEITGANRAQAQVAEQSAADNCINPLIDLLSCTLTDRWGPLYETPKRLAVWIEPWIPTDPDVQIKADMRDQKIVGDTLKMLGDRKLTPEAAKAVIMHFLPDIDEDEVDRMVDQEGLEPITPLAPAPLPPPDEDVPVVDDSDDELDEEVRGVIGRLYDTLEVFEAEVIQRAKACAPSVPDGVTA